MKTSMFGQRTRLARQKQDMLKYVEGDEDEIEIPVPIPLDEISNKVADPKEPHVAIEAHVDAMKVLELAPEALCEPLLRVYVNEEFVKDVAEDIGVSRFKLARDLKCFTEQVRDVA